VFKSKTVSISDWFSLRAHDKTPVTHAFILVSLFIVGGSRCCPKRQIKLLTIYRSPVIMRYTWELWDGGTKD
jgi:hypothetical protein